MGSDLAVPPDAALDAVDAVNALIDRGLDQDNPDGVAAGALAASIFRRLQDEDPALLREWMAAVALPTLSSLVSRRIASRNATARRRLQVRAFGEAALSGDADLLEAFTMMHPTPSGVRKRACDMTGREHEFIAGSAQRTGDTYLMVAEFHRQVGRKAGDRPVRDVMDAVTYGRLLQSITGHNRRGVAA